MSLKQQIDENTVPVDDSTIWHTVTIYHPVQWPRAEIVKQYYNCLWKLKIEPGIGAKKSNTHIFLEFQNLHQIFKYLSNPKTRQPQFSIGR